MANLIVAFDGMSLIVSARGRSEALFVDTDKVRSSHHHEHTVKIAGKEINLRDALVWVEEGGTRLEGSVAINSDFLARLDEIVPGEPLAPQLAATDPDADRGWLDRLAVWMRIPGGELTTAPTATIGGNLGWDFPSQNGQRKITRRLTGTGFLTRTDVTGPLRLALKSLPSGVVMLHDLAPEPSGDYVIRFSTKFVGISDPVPTAGSTVHLLEMQLLYECLQSGTGPIPSAVWPSMTLDSAPQLVGRTAVETPTFVGTVAGVEDRRTAAFGWGVTSDPVIEICPLAVKELGI
jgi:hypothetical protein